MGSKLLKKIIANHCRYLLAIIVLVSIAFSLVACQNSAQESNIKSGIKGIAMIGPIQPISRPGETNEEPYPDAIIIIKSFSDNKEVVRTKVEADGSFILNLSAGRYSLEAINSSGSGLPFAKPMQVEVIAAQFIDVTVNFDSGIR